jgi:hypothetical protein
MTGLWVGGASGLAFMLIPGVITLPTMLWVTSADVHNIIYTCIAMPLAIGAAYGAGDWVKHIARRRRLASPYGIGEKVGGVIGSLIGAIAFTMVIFFIVRP